MPNIVLTTRCNRHCPYCFALDAMQRSEKEALDFGELVQIADMIVASGKPAAGVLGGEPTLHSEFPEMAAYLLRRGIKTTVFTNAVCGAATLDAIERILDVGPLDFIVNVNPPGVDPPGVVEAQEVFLRRFAGRCGLSVNLFRPELDPSYACEVVRRTGQRNGRIRVGLAQPIVDESNEYLRVEWYPRMAERVTALAEEAFGIGMPVSLDCGFPLCAFTDEQLGRLARHGSGAKFYCQPAVDLGPGSRAWSCFPLAKSTRLRVSRTLPFAALFDRFARATAALRTPARPGLFETCGTCPYHRPGVCDGGCLAHAVAARAERCGP